MIFYQSCLPLNSTKAVHDCKGYDTWKHYNLYTDVRMV